MRFKNIKMMILPLKMMVLPLNMIIVCGRALRKCMWLRCCYGKKPYGNPPAVPWCGSCEFQKKLDTQLTTGTRPHGESDSVSGLRNDDSLLKDDDFLLKNDDSLLKNVDFITKNEGHPGASSPNGKRCG